MLLEKEIYKKSLYIREFEKLLLSLFDKGLLHGTTHTAIGQELIPVTILSDISEDDTVVSNHRSHAHFISYCNKINELFLELLGKKTVYVVVNQAVNISIIKILLVMEY